MIRFFFLVPLLLCIFWWLYLRKNNWTIEQGKQGFFYIIGLSAIVMAFYGIVYLFDAQLF